MDSRRALPALVCALVLGAGLLGAPGGDVRAQSLSRGEALYQVLGCDAANCHGTNPAQNLRNVMNGAGSPAAIEYASVTRTEMNHLYATFISDQTAAQDIAAWLRSIAAATPPPPPPPAMPSGPQATVVEYFHAGFGHYFVTSFAADIEALDSGRLAGWARTGKSFKVYTTPQSMLATVCRFFTASFAPKSSHFYTPSSAECTELRTTSRVWQYEGDAFHAQLPDSAGTCPAATRPVYRLYNNGQGGAPNHRFTTDAAVRTEMIARGWLPEGSGTPGVSFCSPE